MTKERPILISGAMARGRRCGPVKAMPAPHKDRANLPSVTETHRLSLLDLSNSHNSRQRHANTSTFALERQESTVCMSLRAEHLAPLITPVVTREDDRRHLLPMRTSKDNDRVHGASYA
ncbi:hypothetical protein CO2235_90215 [Cupriavidus oxalaticus]|uniref:Uncharacterized protein n=1 Tax=Cupriavidus oxalaticus TaxID=96344 RepID=A0A976GBH1_9BURK|nr:hypothetical protein CO2235_90215 [Cupriavidus oxalaticus]